MPSDNHCSRPWPRGWIIASPPHAWSEASTVCCHRFDRTHVEFPGVELGRDEPRALRPEVVLACSITQLGGSQLSLSPLTLRSDSFLYASEKMLRRVLEWPKTGTTRSSSRGKEGNDYLILLGYEVPRPLESDGEAQQQVCTHAEEVCDPVCRREPSLHSASRPLESWRRSVHPDVRRLFRCSPMQLTVSRSRGPES